MNHWLVSFLWRWKSSHLLELINIFGNIINFRLSLAYIEWISISPLVIDSWFSSTFKIFNKFLSFIYLILYFYRLLAFFPLFFNKALKMLLKLEVFVILILLILPYLFSRFLFWILIINKLFESLEFRGFPHIQIINIFN